MQIDKFVVDSQMSMLDVMSRINSNSKGIVYVVDGGQKLIGAITDGDIRRYILKNNTVDGIAMNVMNSKPCYVNENEKKDIEEFIKQMKISSIPIVDKELKIKRIEFADGKRYYGKSDLNIPVVIMAGGKGTRLYPYTQVLPKPLIPIGRKTITEHIMDRFEDFGCTDFTMIINYKKDFIKAFFADDEINHNVMFIEESDFYGTAGGLKLLNGKINSTFFMTNCDILIEENYGAIYEYHKKHNNIITLVCALKKEVIPYGTVISTVEGKLEQLTEKPEFEFLTNTGLYIIEPEFLEEIPNNTFIHITDVIQKCADAGKNVGVYPINESSWMDMGQMEELEKMRKRLEG